MKKNWLLRIALVVLVLTLGTACLVSGTFAKYTTTVSGSDSARVAKWVFGVETDEEAYAYDTPTAKLVGIFDTINLGANLATVVEKDANGEDPAEYGLIAPEAEGDFDIVIDMTGSEVAVTLTSEIEIKNEGDINLKFFIGETKPSTDAGYNLDWSELVDGIAEVPAVSPAVPGLVAAINGNVGQATTMTKTVKVWWKWVSSAGDTARGDAGTAEVTLSIEITATQKVA